MSSLKHFTKGTKYVMCVHKAVVVAHAIAYIECSYKKGLRKLCRNEEIDDCDQGKIADQKSE